MSNGLLKFITCGSVDDGKSTLIGHILYDAKLLYADQEKALQLDSKVGSRGGQSDYSLLLDGLMAEREQGITIDVAYRYFTTDKRSFIVADTPGHEEYTRNMAVGASFAQLAVILIDAKQGVLVQTRRHARICALMGIKHLVFAVNKMDLVDYSEKVFRDIEEQIRKLVFDLENELGLINVQTIPLSATEGDNVTQKSENLPWYEGPALLDYLEKVDVDNRRKEEGFYLPVQRVSRPDHTFRGFQGEIEAGEIAVGDQITALPSGEKAHVKSLYVAGELADSACIGQPVTVQLDREVDVSRGCVLVKDTAPVVTNRLAAALLWMDDEPLIGTRDFFVKLGTQLIPGQVRFIRYTIDVNSGEHRAAETLNKNELALCEISLAHPAVLDVFTKHKVLGELLLIDRVSNATSACGVVREATQAETRELKAITPEARAAQKAQTPYVVFTANPENAEELEKKLYLYNRHTMLVREGYDPVSAAELLHQAGLITLLPKTLLTNEQMLEVAERIPDAHLLDLTIQADGESLLLR